MSAQRTISFPSQELIDAVGSLPENLKPVLWDLQTDPQVPLEDIEIAVMPYMAAPAALRNVRKAPNLKIVQTQTTGYDGMVELIGDRADINTAAGVHAASTAEMAIGLAIASPRGFPQAVRDQRDARWNPRSGQDWPIGPWALLALGVSARRSAGGWNLLRSICRALAPWLAQMTTARSSPPATLLPMLQRSRC